MTKTTIIPSAQRAIADQAATARLWKVEDAPSFSVGSPRIERDILPLVEALNAMPGIRTYASCEGHGNKSPLRRHRPGSAYVAFWADSRATTLLTALSRSLNGTRNAYPMLRFYWTLDASLHPQTAFEKLSWVIRLVSVNRPTDWYCKPLIEDIAQIVAFVHAATDRHAMEAIKYARAH